jgi:hypothetical protein
MGDAAIMVYGALRVLLVNTIVFYGSSRFRDSLTPISGVLAGVALQDLWLACRKRICKCNRRVLVTHK